jgi:hypothetical protein
MMEGIIVSLLILYIAFSESTFIVHYDIKLKLIKYKITIWSLKVMKKNKILICALMGLGFSSLIAKPGVGSEIMMQTIKSDIYKHQLDYLDKNPAALNYLETRIILNDLEKKVQESTSTFKRMEEKIKTDEDIIDDLEKEVQESTSTFNGMEEKIKSLAEIINDLHNQVEVNKVIIDDNEHLFSVVDINLMRDFASKYPTVYKRFIQKINSDAKAATGISVSSNLVTTAQTFNIILSYLDKKEAFKIKNSLNKHNNEHVSDYIKMVSSQQDPESDYNFFGKALNAEIFKYDDDQIFNFMTKFSNKNEVFSNLSIFLTKEGYLKFLKEYEGTIKNIYIPSKYFDTDTLETIGRLDFPQANKITVFGEIKIGTIREKLDENKMHQLIPSLLSKPQIVSMEIANYDIQQPFILPIPIQCNEELKNNTITKYIFNNCALDMTSGDISYSFFRVKNKIDLEIINTEYIIQGQGDVYDFIGPLNSSELNSISIDLLTFCNDYIRKNHNVDINELFNTFKDKLIDKNINIKSIEL